MEKIPVVVRFYLKLLLVHEGALYRVIVGTVTSRRVSVVGPTTTYSPPYFLFVTFFLPVLPYPLPFSLSSSSCSTIPHIGADVFFSGTT
jgi:hypothetical protein